MDLIQINIAQAPGLELIVGAIGVFAAMVGVIAVIETAIQASASANARQPTPADLTGRLTMSVAARSRANRPMNLRFTFSDPAVTLFRIEIANQLSRKTESAKCVKEAPRVYVAKVEPTVVQSWYNGNPYWDGEIKQLPIRVSFVANGQAECRTIWVKMRPQAISGAAVPDASDFAWFLEGPSLTEQSRLLYMPGSTHLRPKNRSEDTDPPHSSKAAR